MFIRLVFSACRSIKSVAMGYLGEYFELGVISLRGGGGGGGGVHH